VLLDEPKVKEVLGLTDEEAIPKLARALAAMDTAQALEELDAIYRDGRDLRGTLDSLAVLLRDTLLAATAGSGVPLRSGVSEEAVQELAQMLQPERMLQMIRTIGDATSRMQRSGGDRTDAELCLIRLCMPAAPAAAVPGTVQPVSVPAVQKVQAVIPESVLARLTALEQKLQDGAVVVEKEEKTEPAQKPAVEAEQPKSPKKPEQPNLPPPKELPDAEQDALNTAAKSAIAPLAFAFFAPAKKYWNGRTLTVVVDDFIRFTLEEAKTRDALQQVAHQVLGPDARLVLASETPVGEADDKSGFDTIMQNYQEAGQK